MANLSPGTIVAQGECADCGKPVKIKLNKNGIAYYFCIWPTDDGERCSHHQKWGRTASQQMQRDFIAARNLAKLRMQTMNDQPDQLPTFNTRRKPTPGRDDDDGDIFRKYG